MYITVNFESYAEMKDFAYKVLGARPRTPAEQKQAETAQTAPKAEPAPAEPEQTAPKAEPAEEVSESDVKILLTAALKAGKKPKVKALFDSYGVSKLSELIEKHSDKLAEIYAAAKEI